MEESFIQAANWLDVCDRNGITLNPDKFVFCQEGVEFAGFSITMNNVRPCNKYLQAIREFPTPRNITDIRSWFGLVNQVSYAFSMAERMLQFRELLKPGNSFAWNDDLEDIFAEPKEAIAADVEEGVLIFDKARPTCLATDWSKDGIGFWVFQKHCTCPGTTPFCCRDGWKISLVGSRFTHAAESRYAHIEGESLAVADALEKARFFVLGCSDLIVAVDHKPLLKILGDHSLDDITNACLRNLNEKNPEVQVQDDAHIRHSQQSCGRNFPTSLMRHQPRETVPTRRHRAHSNCHGHPTHVLRRHSLSWHCKLG